MDSSSNVNHSWLVVKEKVAAVTATLSNGKPKQLLKGMFIIAHMEVLDNV